MLALAVLFLVVPIAELAVIVAVAGEIGVLDTIGLLILVSVVGAWLCQREGVGVLRRLRAQLQSGTPVHRELIDGFLVLFAGTLLLTPGFLSDLLAVALLLPPTRAAVRAVIVRGFRRRSALFRVVTLGGPRPHDGSPGRGGWVDVDGSPVEPPGHGRRGSGGRRPPETPEISR